MKLLLLYKTSPESPTFNTPSSFAVQGNVLFRGLSEIGVDCRIVDRRNHEEKAASYKEFKPDFVVGIGYWGDVPELVLHPLEYKQKPIPWLVADGAVLNYQDYLNKLSLILATSNWTKEVLIRDGINTLVKVVYEGVDTRIFEPISKETGNVKKFRSMFKVKEDEILILTVGGDAKSKGFQEVISALKLLEGKFDNWKFVVKVASSPFGQDQTEEDLALTRNLGFEKKVFFFSEMLSKLDQACLFNAADIYASPSHNEGFGRPLVEAQACSNPVLTVNGTTTKEVVKHKLSGYTAKVGEEIYRQEFFYEGEEIKLEKPKLVGVKADPQDLASYLMLLKNPKLRKKMGEQGRKFVLDNFDYRVSARKMVEAIEGTYG